jgi:hypothetical protein
MLPWVVLQHRCGAKGIACNTFVLPTLNLVAEHWLMMDGGSQPVGAPGSFQIRANLAMKVNAKVGGFNLRMAPADYPKRWQDLMARGSFKQQVDQKVMEFYPAIILIGKVPAVVSRSPGL